MAKKDNKAPTLAKPPCCHLQWHIKSPTLTTLLSLSAIVVTPIFKARKENRVAEQLLCHQVGHSAVPRSTGLPSCFFVCIPHCPFGSMSPRGESSPRRFALRPEPNDHKHRHMLPKSVKIKGSLSQPGQKPRWERAKANEGNPSLSSVPTEPLGAKRQVAWGPFCAFVQNNLGTIFLLCCKRGATASLLVPPATEQRLQYASRLSLKWKKTQP